MSYKIKTGTLIFIASLSGGVAQAETTWDERYFNPGPAEDDVVLPMPCDGAMVFRKVHIPLVDPLEDYPVQLGQDGEEWGYVEHSRPTFISGSFTEKGPDKSRYYLMAKYELSQLQYKAIMNEECPKASNKERLPQVSLSWLEAMQAAAKYNVWLRQQGTEALPKEDGVPGFLRLPTEVEWEFAARGGLQVATSEFRDSRYPMDEGLNVYEWFAGSRSSNGKLQLAGLLKPNPLGLHDMLGNADEMIFEPFRLNKLDRQHGQAGGYVIRGGNFRTSQDDIRTAARREESYYNDEGQVRSGNTGFRLVLVSPTLTSRERVADIEQSWKALGSGNDEPQGNGTAQELGELASGVEDEKLKARLKALESQLRASNQQQEEARDQAIRASLNLGAFLCTKMLDDGRYLDFLNRNYELNCEGETADSSCDMRKTKLDEQQDRLRKLSRYYASSLVESASLYGEKLLEKQTVVMHQILNKNPNLKELAPYMDAHWDNQKSFLKSQKIDTSVWLDSCKKVQG